MSGWIGSYCGAAPDAVTWAARWNSDPILLSALAIGFAIAFRWPSQRRNAGIGAVAALAVAFVSPLCALSVALFAARSLHHLILVGLVAPLMAIAWPARRAMPPAAALALSAATLWAWHIPGAYDAALANKAIYWAMQASLGATAWAYWDAVRRAPASVALPFVATGAAQMGLLGALLTFAPRPLYETHLSTTVAFGIGPLADQQLAGLVMWVIGLVPYALAAAVLARGAWRRMAT